MFERITLLITEQVSTMKEKDKLCTDFLKNFHSTSYDVNNCFVEFQAAYPPNHYIRKVPQRMIHLFTGCQCMQLLVLCAFGFAPTPYAKMIFPVVILFFLPVRHKIIPYIIDKKFLDVLDG